MSRPCGPPAALCQHIAILRFMSFAYFDRILICIIRALFDVLGVSAGGDGIVVVPVLVVLWWTMVLLLLVQVQ